MKKIAILSAVLLSAGTLAFAQESAKPDTLTIESGPVWTLQDCINYAVENNISLQQSRNNYLSSLEDTYLAEAAQLPTVSGSLSGSGSNYPFGDDSFSSLSLTPGVNASMTLFQGGTLKNNIKKSRIQNSIDSLSVEQNAIDIKIAIIEAYMRCLYAREAITVNEKIADASKTSRDRAYEMWKAGSISKVDYTQLESQWYSDRYQVTTSRVAFDTYKLQLKQLLELGVNEDITLAGSDATDEEALAMIPDKATVYENALQTLPEVKSGDLAIDVAELEEKNAKAGYLPTVTANAGIGSTYSYLTNSASGNDAFGTQLGDYFHENVGVTVSIPIFSARKNKTAVNKAHLSYINSQLDKKSTQMAVLSDVETTWLNAVSAQSQFISAREQQEYAQQSFDLTKEQFRLGMKNIVELITAENSLLQAAQSALQAKYTALLNKEVLEVYQGLQ